MNIDTNQQALVDRYLRQELSASELEAFEQQLLWDTSLQDDVHYTMQLRDGLRASASPVASHAKPAALRTYSMAATALLAITSFGWITSYQQSQDHPSPGTTSSRVYSIEALRGANNDSSPLLRVTPGEKDEAVTLLVYPELTGFTTYQPRLTRLAAGKWDVVWQGPERPANESDTVAVTLSSSLFEPGTYKLEVIAAAHGRSELVEETPFQVPQQ